MSTVNRREFLRHSTLGLAVAGATSWTLRADAEPTEPAGDPDVAEHVLKQLGEAPATIRLTDTAKPTTQAGAGPAYQSGSPFRGKTCPPFEPGTVMLVSGRVWAHDTRRPLPGALLDIWHVDIHGNYSGGNGDFRNRTRLIASESGAYEFEAIRPVPYGAAPGLQRCAHFHIKVDHPGYTTLLTECQFRGGGNQDVDPMYKPDLAMPVEKHTATDGRAYETVVFDIVLARA